MNLSALYGNLYHVVLAVFEQPIGFVDAFERETMCNQWCGVDKALLYKTQYLGTVATVDAACLECQVFAVHIWQRQALRAVVKRDDGDYGVRPRALPGELKALVRAAALYDAVVYPAI